MTNTRLCALNKDYETQCALFVYIFQSSLEFEGGRLWTTETGKTKLQTYRCHLYCVYLNFKLIIFLLFLLHFLVSPQGPREHVYWKRKFSWSALEIIWHSSIAFCLCWEAFEKLNPKCAYTCSTQWARAMSSSSSSSSSC